MFFYSPGVQMLLFIHIIFYIRRTATKKNEAANHPDCLRNKFCARCSYRRISNYWSKQKRRRCYYLDADAAAYTQRLWDPHNLTLRSHFNTQLTCKHTHTWMSFIYLFILGVKALEIINKMIASPYWPIRTTGQLFLHSWRHFLGLHLSWLTMAILVFLSAMMEGRNDGR